MSDHGFYPMPGGLIRPQPMFLIDGKAWPVGESVPYDIVTLLLEGRERQRTSAVESERDACERLCREVAWKHTDNAGKDAAMECAKAVRERS